MKQLPPANKPFLAKKAQILQKLAVPDAEYTDASPKGSVDIAVRTLIDEINSVEGYVTTSSCAGRVSVFLEGKKSRSQATESDGVIQQSGHDESEFTQIAGIGGKGGGGRWLFVSHEPLVGEADQDWAKTLGLHTGNPQEATGRETERRLIHFKFEPMILHISTTSSAHASLVLNCGLQAGFRESGAVNIIPSPGHEESATPIVAIRSMGLGFESLIGVDVDGQLQSTVSAEYLNMIVAVSGERFAENTKRIARFRESFLRATQAAKPGTNQVGDSWEDAETRRRRMREEGLRRRGEAVEKDHTRPEETDLDLSSLTS